jgi:hypothetical protein
MRGKAAYTSLHGNHQRLLYRRRSHESSDKVHVEEFLSHNIQKHPKVPGNYQSNS